jgi:hypothetical protein
MRTTLIGWSIVLLSLSMFVASRAGAQDAPHGHDAAAVAPAPHADVAHADNAHAASPDHRPTLPSESPWPGILIILILGMFLAAAIVGPVVRYHAPEEVPAASSHDEHGGGAHRHDAHDGHGHAHGH